VLEVKGLRAGYGRIPALHGIDLGVRRGELVALVGANGAGKTTLLRALSGVQPAVGSVIFDRTAIESFSAEKRVACGIVQCPEGRQVFGPLSVDDNLRLGAYRRGRADTARSLERVYGLFPALAGHRSQAAGTLSGGQQQMLAIGRALMSRPRVLLLDEPSMGLAPLIVKQISDVLVKIKQGGMTMVLIEQNPDFAFALADRCCILESGHVVLEGATEVLRNHEQMASLYLGGSL